MYCIVTLLAYKEVTATEYESQDCQRQWLQTFLALVSPGFPGSKRKCVAGLSLMPEKLGQLGYSQQSPEMA